MTIVGPRNNTRGLLLLADCCRPISRQVVLLKFVDEVGQVVLHGVVPVTARD